MKASSSGINAARPKTAKPTNESPNKQRHTENFDASNN
jgi:hypothetical protein